jgi:hypothetical protein
MQSLLYTFGCELVLNPEIAKTRLYFNLGEVSEDNIIDLAINEIDKRLKIDLVNFNPEIIKRDNPVNFYLNWHIDDCAVFKHNSTQNKKNNVPLNDTYSLFHMKVLPKYTMIIYLSSINVDFRGGELEFVNQLIKPKKYDVVFFDSREVHRVKRFRDGTRKNILIKFFEKDNH